MVSRLIRLAAATCLATWILLSATAVAQQPGVEFAVEPGPKSQTAEGGGYFVIRTDPGRRIRQSVTLRNESGRSVTLKLAAVDATTGQLGGVSYGLPEDPIERTGAWIVLDRTTVPLEAGEGRSVGFEVSVPPDAGQGQHVAGIAVWEVGAEEQNGGGEAVSVVVQTRRIVAVQIDLPGPKNPELVITGVEPAARPDGLYLEIGIENQGTAMTTGEGTIEIPAQAFIKDFFVDTFVPGTSIGYPIKWSDDPREGVYDARVQIEYEGGVAEWAGQFTVGDPVIAELEDRGVDVPGGLPLLPLTAVVGGVAAAAAAWWTLRMRKRRPALHPVARATRPAPGLTYTPAPPSRAEPPVISPRRSAPPPPPPPPPRTPGPR